MPKTGTPPANMAGSVGGASAAYTLDGPPDRMMALGCRAISCATGVVCGTISE